MAREVEMKILVIEDEARLAKLIARVLREEGYSPQMETDGRTGLSEALAGDFDLLIVDWMLPDLDGIQIIKRLRVAEVAVPVLMLTARTQIEDRVEGLDAGADDYLPKPFAFAELLARVRALSRWPREQSRDPVFRSGQIALDPVRHVVWHGKEEVDVSAREFALLATLLRRPGQVFTRSVLLDTVWGGSADVYTNVVDLYVSYLRKKLDQPGQPSYIRTVRGAGYAFEPQPGE